MPNGRPMTREALYEGLRDEVTILKTQISGVVSDISDIRTALGAGLADLRLSINRISEEQRLRDKPNWANVIAALMFAAVLLGGGWMIMGLEMQNMIAPVSSDLRSIERTYSAQWANQQRLNTILWDAVSNVGAKLPPQPQAPYYFPEIK